MTVDVASAPPFVGPRPFERTEADSGRFFGREDEATAVAALVLSYRSVLLYGGSGTGKTSLVNTHLVERLSQFGVRVLPSIRPAQVEPASLQAIVRSSQTVHHRVVTDPADESAGGAATSTLLVLDQFEEVMYDTSRAGRRRLISFLESLQELIGQGVGVRVLIVLREEYLAQLASKATWLSPGLTTASYRLEPLTRSQAAQAATGPLATTDVRFDHEALNHLLDDLAFSESESVSAETERFVDGLPAIEPLHLQVVCADLWRSLPAGRTDIGMEELQRLGSVHDSLVRFVDDAISSVSAECETPEIEIRRWIESELVTPIQTRSFVVGSGDLVGRMSRDVVEALERRSVLRREQRAGATWYELTHDRLVPAMLASTSRWLATSGAVLLDPADQWEQHAHDASYTLTGRRLAHALEWTASHPDMVGPREELFLRVSVARTRRRRWTMAALILVVITLLATTALSSTFYLRARASEAAAGDAALEAAAASKLAERNADEALRLAALADERTAAATAAEQRAEAEARAAQTGAWISRSEALSELQDPWGSIAYAAAADTYGSADDPSNARDAYTRSILDLADVPVLLEEVVARGDGDNRRRGLDWSPNGDWYVATPGTGIGYWRADGKYMGQLPGLAPHEIAWTVEVSSAGHVAAITSLYRVCIWTLPTVLSNCLPVPEDVGAWWWLAWSPSSDRLAVAGSLGEIWVLESATGSVVGAVSDGRGAAISDIDWSRNGDYLATAGGTDGRVNIFDATGFSFLASQVIVIPGGQWVESVAFSPDGEQLASGTSTGDVVILESGSLDEVARVGTIDDDIGVVEWAPDGEHLLGTGVTPTLVIWETEGWRQVGDPVHAYSQSSVEDAAWAVDGGMLATISASGDVHSWSLPLGGEELEDHPGWVWDATWSSDSTMLATASGHGVRVWDVEKGEVSGSPVPMSSLTRDIDWHPSRPMLSAIVGDGTLAVVDLSSQIPTVRSVVAHSDRGMATAWSADGAFVATASSGGEVAVWGGTDLVRVAAAEGHESWINSVEWSPHGSQLATAGADAVVRVWAFDGGMLQLIHEFPHDNEVFSVRWHPRSDRILTTTTGGSLTVWGIETGRPLGPALRERGSGALAGSWSPDGQLVLTGDQAGSLRVWDTESGQPLGDPIAQHSGRVRSIAWSPNARFVATGSQDGSARVLEVITPNEVCARIELNISAQLASANNVDLPACHPSQASIKSGLPAIPAQFQW